MPDHSSDKAAGNGRLGRPFATRTGRKRRPVSASVIVSCPRLSGMYVCVYVCVCAYVCVCVHVYSGVFVYNIRVYVCMYIV